MEPSRKLNNWLTSASKPCEMELTVLRHDCTPLPSTWKAKARLRSRNFLRFIVQKSANGSAVGKKTASKGCWKDTGLDDRSVCPKNNAKPLQTFSTVAPLPMDSMLASGPVQWYAGLLKMNFLSSIIPRISPESCMSLTFPFSGPRKYWLEPTKRFNHDGFVINIPTLKKSQKRKSGHPLRGRSQFPARPNPSPDMGKGRLPATNPQYGATQYTQIFWNHRIIPRPVPLSFSGGLQRADIYPLSRKSPAQLLPPKNLSYSRQCFLSQRPYRLGLVQQPSQTYRSFQSSGVFSEPECFRKNLASHAPLRYSQQIFQNTIRTAVDFNFDLSKHPTQSKAGHGLPSSLSMNYVALFMQAYIVRFKGMTTYSL